MFKRFKPVYTVKWRDTLYPKDVYATWLHRLLGVPSPSRVWVLWYRGGDALAQYRRANINRIRLRVNKRQCTRDEYKALRHYERTTEKEGNK